MSSEDNQLPISEADSPSSPISEDASEDSASDNLQPFVCEHYQHSIHLFAPCCEKWFPCHRCHNESEDHELPRADVDQIRCLKCQTVQPVSNQCQNASCSAHEQLDTDFCAICLIWSSNPNRPIYHCDKCGNCRVGIKENMQHCDTCNCCLSRDTQHQCKYMVQDQNCPICLDPLIDKQCGIVMLPCLHSVCSQCMRNNLCAGQYQCPVCKRSAVDLSLQWQVIDRLLLTHQMPEDFRFHRTDILCNDCLKKTKAVRYHFQYHKCLPCGSYNTAILKTYQDLPRRPVSHSRTRSVPAEVRYVGFRPYSPQSSSVTYS